MAIQLYGKRPQVKQRPFTGSTSELQSNAASDTAQSYTVPGKNNPVVPGQDNFQKLVNFGRGVGNAVLGVLTRLNAPRKK